jgi:hypothetical protein
MLDIHLDKDKKIKLIELLLIVGAILAAFNLPPQHILLFMLFVLFSIWYYIEVQTGNETGLILTIIAAFVATSFVGIITYNIVICLIDSIYNVSNLISIIFVLIISIVYYLFFSYLIFIALTRNGKSD